MEKDYFEQIRVRLCLRDSAIALGKMMSSEAVTYRGKVFAFFSGRNTMVFKLGKSYDLSADSIEIAVFNPFTKRPPLYGWFEIPYSHAQYWFDYALKALTHVKSV